MKKIKIGGIIQNLDLAHVGVLSAPDHPGVAGKIMGALGSEGINIQFIVHSVDLTGRGNIVFCVERRDLHRTLQILERTQPEGSYEKVTHHAPVAIISIFGPHFREKPAIAGTMFAALGDMGINIMAISTSISTLSCVIDEALLPDAVKAICETFELP
jgi:aspartokinase